MRIFKITIITSLLSVIFVYGTVQALGLQTGEQAIANILLPNVSRRDRRRAGHLRTEAYLYISTDPVWANIFIDGRNMGKGTAMVTRAKGSPFVSIKITAPHRETINGWLRLEPQKVLKIRAKLKRKGGNLTFLTKPNSAEVILDGVDSGQTPITISNLEPGPHMVELHSGEWQWKARLQVKTGKTQVLKMDIPAIVVKPAVKPVVKAAPQRPATKTVEPVKTPEKKQEQTVSTRPEKKQTVDLSQKKPDCQKICNHYVAASNASKTVQDMLKPACIKRCDSMDMNFSICAWKAKSMADVQKCADIPQKK